MLWNQCEKSITHELLKGLNWALTGRSLFSQRPQLELWAYSWDYGVYCKYPCPTKLGHWAYSKLFLWATSPWICLQICSSSPYLFFFDCPSHMFLLPVWSQAIRSPKVEQIQMKLSDIGPGLCGVLFLALRIVCFLRLVARWLPGAP